MAEKKEIKEENTVVEENQDTEVEVAIPESKEKVEVVKEETSKTKDEHEQYTDSVQNRINKLTKRMREAERQKEEALKYAQNIQSETEKVKERLKALDQGYMTEYGGRISVEEKQAESELKRAVELGDADATVAAQKKLTDLAVAKSRYNEAKVVHDQQLEQEKIKAQQAQQSQQVSPQSVQQPPRRPDPKAEHWAKKNEWFGQDEAMTFAAFGIHKKLVEQEGFDASSDEYYTALDNRLKEEFPQKFNNGEAPKKASQTVAGVTRSTASSSTGRNRKVRLTPSQVTIAKKLGVPLEEYAKYVK